MKKIFFLFCLFFFLIPSTLANTDFLVKKTTSWDETYTNNLQEISQNSSLTFEISALWWTSAKDYQINFPTWFIYNNHQISGNCTTNISHVSNSILKYQFSHSSACVSVVTFSYTPSIAGNYTLSILEWNTLIKHVQIWVTSNNTIIKAYSLDQNNNWYIDGYEIHFAQNTDNFNITWLKVWDENVVSYIWNSSSWIIDFTDNIFTTGDLPQITSNGVTFWNVWMISNNSIIEEDMVAPMLSQINGTSVINSHTGYISTGSVVLDFSENLHPLSKNYFQIQQAWVNINGIFLQTGWIVTFSPTLNFWVWNYELNILSWVKDYSDNSVSVWSTKTLVLTGTVVQNCTWLPTNASWNSVWSVSRYWNGSVWTPTTLTGTYNETPSTSECRFVCNSGFWYNNTLNTCIDNVAPVWWILGSGTGILINNGASTTETRNVTLSLLANDNVWVSQMMISDNSNFTWANWENYTTTKSFILSGANAGNKIVYVKFRDIAENESSIYSDSILYSPLDSYINFSTGTTIYTNSSESLLSGNCRYIDEFWMESSNSLTYTINNAGTGNLNCVNNTWSGSFQITQNTTHSIKIWFTLNPNIHNSLNVIHPIPTCSAPNNGYALWTYPQCDFACNNGYTKSGNSCILTSTGGWGWGWGWASVSLCTDTQLECTLYNGNYVWLRKPWISCNGGNLGNSCQGWDQSSLWESIGDTSWSQNTKNNDTFYTDAKREEIKKYLLSSTRSSLHKIINNLSDMIHYPHTDFFVEYSKNFREDYKWLLIQYQELMIKIDKYLITKERNTLIEAKRDYDNLNIYLSRTKNFEEKYITKIKKWNDIIYKTKIKSIFQPLSQIEKVIIWKYKKQLLSGSISQTQYKKQILTYNEFVLYLSIFRWEKNALSREYGKKAWEKVIQNYMTR